MTDEKKCPQCGADLPPDSPEGLCPKCLMKQGLESAPEGHTPPGGFVPPDPLELAPQFPQLEILELVGRGGMGAVYKARQPQLDRFVALKILPAQIGEDPEFAERFTREARALAKLNHPNIVAVYDFGRTEDDLFYFVMEFVDGPNLRGVIQGKELTPQQALAIVPQVCDALQYAHEEGIVHRDIKPENILLDKKGRVKIADFGLAKLLGVESAGFTLTGTQQVMGTPHYMAPEQFDNPLVVDHRADIYSLGVVLYEMLTGELPIGRFAPPSQKVQIDVRLDEVVLKTLENKPDLRYQKASEVKTDVERFSERSSPVSPMSRDEKSAPAQLVSHRFNMKKFVGAVVTGISLFGLIYFICNLIFNQGAPLSWGMIAMSIPGIVFFSVGLLIGFTLLFLGHRSSRRYAHVPQTVEADLASAAGVTASPIGVPSISVPSTPGIRAAMKRRWLTWYADRSPNSMRIIKGTLLVVLFPCLLFWLSWGGSSMGGNASYRLGTPSPWVEYKFESEGTTSSSGFHFYLSFSWFFMLGYILAYKGYVAIKEAETNPTSSKWELRGFKISVNCIMYFTLIVFLSMAFSHPWRNDSYSLSQAEAPKLITAFKPSDTPIDQDSIIQEEDSWRLDVEEAMTIHLFEIPDPGVEDCMLTYRAQLKTENTSGKAYLEMWVRLPGLGESFSKGFHNAVEGTNDWDSYDIPFRLESGQRPDLIKLNLVSEGTGTIWIKDVRLLQSPLE